MFGWRLKIIQINVAQLLKAGVGATRTYEVNDVTDITGEGFESLVKGQVTLTRTDRSILVKGTLTTEIELDCGRCLKPFRCPLTLNIEDVYFPTLDVTTGLPVSLSDEPGAFTVDVHHVLDLTEAIQQYTVMAVPMKPLCRDECLGLCPECGANLNLEECQCRRLSVDPRWANLTQVRVNKSENQEKGEK